MANGPLSALLRIISEGVRTLESTYSKNNATFPSLDEPFTPGPLDNNPDIVAAKQLAVAAAYQLIATVQSPLEHLQERGLSMYSTASLGLVEEVDVADTIKQAGSEGLHVNDIAHKSGVDPAKLTRVLRYLASRHIFREIAPDVYANNRLSSLLLKNKPLEELRKDPLTKYDGAATAAFINHAADECLKGAAYLKDFIKGRPEGVDTPWNLATGRKETVWQWFQEPDNLWRFHRFTAAMKGAADGFPSSIFTGGLDWGSLARDSVVVDVGGGVGKVAQTLFKDFPHLKYVVEDLPPVIKDGETFWTASSPKALEEGRVTLKAQDFFEPQAVKEAAVYYLRFVIHDWADAPSIKILENLRKVAAPNTRLVLFDILMHHVCDVPGGPSPPPEPLVGSPGLSFITMADLQMLTMCNGQERTEAQFRALGAAAGWKLENVKPGPLAAFIFSPA
ncbi:S-adenosyl-L-methionine-dependent methyltransferase [Gloeopeniophorella convolvens]|nr:S-adenosyl-L-methionine-dependent methyltransferase [Gloeopeniophorella convolvens]